jgi:two-component system chemotaxis response regulator CheY
MSAIERNPYEDLVVLVVEDEPQTRMLITKMLRRIGLVWIKEAQDGLSGFSEALQSRPNLVLCDIHMEPGDGFEFLKRLRDLGDPVLSRTPVVFLTADSERDAVLAARDLHVDGYLLKPVRLWDLKARLDALLKRA